MGERIIIMELSSGIINTRVMGQFFIEYLFYLIMSLIEWFVKKMTVISSTQSGGQAGFVTML